MSKACGKNNVVLQHHWHARSRRWSGYIAPNDWIRETFCLVKRGSYVLVNAYTHNFTTDRKPVSCSLRIMCWVARYTIRTWCNVLKLEADTLFLGLKKLMRDTKKVTKQSVGPRHGTSLFSPRTYWTYLKIVRKQYWILFAPPQKKCKLNLELV